MNTTATHKQRNVFFNRPGDLQLFSFTLTLIEPDSARDVVFTGHRNQPIAVQVKLLRVRFADSDVVLRRTHFLDENVTRAGRNQVNLEVAFAHVDFLCKLAFDGATGLAITATNPTLIFGRVGVDNPVASDTL